MMDGQANYRVDEALDQAGSDATDEQRAFDTFVAEGGQSTLEGMMQLILASPQSAPLVLDMLDRAQDWPMAAEIARQVREMLQPEIPAVGDAQSEPLAERDEAKLAPEQAAPIDPVRETTIAASMAANRAAGEAGRQFMARAYEANRVVALAAAETMVAHAQVAIATLKWEPENVPMVAVHLIEADRQLKIAGNAVDIRLRLTAASDDALGG